MTREVVEWECTNCSRRTKRSNMHGPCPDCGQWGYRKPVHSGRLEKPRDLPNYRLGEENPTVEAVA